MSEVVFTMPGKAGDAVHQWPVAYHWAKQTGKRLTLWLDRPSCTMVAPLFEAQPCVEKIEFVKGVENWSMGGQPWHFDLPSSEYANRTVYHLGLRVPPQRQLTLECLSQARVPVDVTEQALAEECPFVAPEGPKVNRLVLHGTGVCGHTRSTPEFWRFLAGIRHELPGLFDEIVFVGSNRDREVALNTYPEWGEFDDGGDFKLLADYLMQSRCFIGCGSSPGALAQWVKIPCIRVHDPIGGFPKVVWSGLGDQQINDSEIELRTSWPAFRAKWLAGVPA